MSYRWEKKLASALFAIGFMIALLLASCPAKAVTAKPVLTAYAADTWARTAALCPTSAVVMIPRPSGTMSLSVPSPTGLDHPLWLTTCWYKEPRSWKRPPRRPRS